MSKRAEPYDSTNPKHVRAAKKNRAVLDERMANGLAKIVADDDCRHVLNLFLDAAGPFRDGFEKDSHVHAHSAGWKSAGLWWITNGLLHDKDFVSKILSDDGSPIVESQDDGHDDFNDDSGPGDIGG